MEKLTAYVTILGAIIAVGQAGSTWIDGIYNERNARIKSEQELDLQKLKDTSDLAQSYLNIILTKEENTSDRVLLLDALRQIPDHPLRDWANARYNKFVKFQEDLRLLAIRKAEVNAAESSLSQQEKSLMTEIEEINFRLDNTQDAQKMEEFRLTLTEKTASLEMIRDEIKTSQLNSNVILDIETRARESPLGGDAVQTAELAASTIRDDVARIADAVDPKLMSRVFAPSETIERDYVFLQNALKEFDISDRRLVALIVATLAIEIPTFSSYTESEAAGARYEGRKGLGNVEPGDGVRFRGRGYIGLTGRANYAAMSRRLGVDLLTKPDDAAQPDIAARIAVAYISDRRALMLQNLQEGNFGGIRRAVIGSQKDADRLKSYYEKILAGLPEPSPLSLVVPPVADAAVPR